MPTILDRIVAAKRRELAEQVSGPLAQLEAGLADLPPVRSLYDALTRPGEVRVLAEVKKASPSAGVFRPDFDPAEIARAYEANGAAGVSVLTDAEFFQGSLADLRAVRAAVGLPVLRKEFILDRYQLVEARLAGADAVLLIAEILPGAELARLHAEARDLGLEVLVEFHDAHELPRVLDCGAELVGINNRDLRTFETSLNRTLELMPRVPPGVAVVSESGVRTRADLDLLGAAGVKAVLVGEAFVRAADPGAALLKLRRGEADS